MLFDIIDISDEELIKLSVAKMKLLRTAQQKKDALIHNAEKELAQYKEKLLTAGMKDSTLYDDKKAELDAEVEYQCAILADNLVYDMSVSSSGGSGEENIDDYYYTVDYSLSYNERYIIVRDYYLSIKDKTERMARYSADEVAKKYLGSYYGTLYNVLATKD